MKYLAASLGLALLAGATTPALADDKWDRLPWSDTQPLTLRAGYNTVMQYPHARAIERFSHRVAERTGEVLRIETFPSERHSAANGRCSRASLPATSTWRRSRPAW